MPKDDLNVLYGTKDDYRDEFGAFLDEHAKKPSANDSTLHAVRSIHQRMVSNRNGMTRAHYEAAKASILRGDTLCEFMRAENSHVINSTGSGLTYHAGKVAHYGVYYTGSCSGSAPSE